MNWETLQNERGGYEHVKIIKHTNLLLSLCYLLICYGGINKNAFSLQNSNFLEILKHLTQTIRTYFERAENIMYSDTHFLKTSDLTARYKI